MSLYVAMFSAFIVGLLGSTHCIGMCGGIVGAVSFGTPRGKRALGFMLLYNLGRISSYSVAGAMFGLLGEQFYRQVPAEAMQPIAKLVGGGFLIALGLYLSGVWRGLVWLERLGASLWMRIAPFGRRLLPVDRPLKALLLGVVWGWLPCGMVYTMLAWSLAAGSALQGAAVTAAFGAGTLPILLLMGAAAQWFAHARNRWWVRGAIGMALLALGLYTLLGPTAHFHALEISQDFLDFRRYTPRMLNA